MMELRPYQRAAIDTLWGFWGKGGGNPLVEMATGTGKSVVIATLVRELIETYPDMRVLMLVHVKELVAQNFQALVRTWPQAPAGINSAGLGRRDRFSQVLFASIQSVQRDDCHSIGKRDIVLVDEAHLIPRAGDGMYQKLLGRLRDGVPDMRIAGFTATPYRLDSGRLDRGEGRLFDQIAYSYGIGRGIDDGYLSPLVSKATATALDTRGVARRGGEFVAGALEVAVDKDWITRAAVDEIVTFGADRRSWLVFCSGVRHAAHVAEEIRSRGVSCAAVTGETPSGERDRLIAAFKAGQIRCLTNAMVLTTGFDAPGVDLIAMLRPTLSTGLYVQIVGRGTRLADGKENCIAEGQRVLTDHGLVPIERVTTAMKVWDGVEFVAHCGIVFRGEREVMRYAGLEATPDHRVWTEEGWKTLGQCALEQAAIAITGDGWTPVRTAESRFRRDRAEEAGRQAASAGRMHWLWRTLAQGIYELDEGLRRLSFLLQPATGPKVAGDAGDFRKATLHEPQGLGFRSLWWTRHPLRVRLADRHGGLGSGEPWPASGNGVGPDRKRRTLCARQPSLSQPQTEPIEQARRAADTEVARIQSGASGSPIRGQHAEAAAGGRHDAGGDRRSLPTAVGQTKRRVWDILNAGPRHSFTVEGLLVHNCLVLDFAGNVRRHGPVDAVEPAAGPKCGSDGETEVRAKECPACATLVALNARACPTCGHEWPVRDKPKHEATADAETAIISRGAPAWVAVDQVRYFRHEKYGSPPSMRVEYLAGMTVHREWVCLEHTGFARSKAETWWGRAAGTAPPRTTDEALSRLAELRAPVAIQVRPSGKYFEVVGRRYEQRERAA